MSPRGISTIGPRKWSLTWCRDCIASTGSLPSLSLTTLILPAAAIVSCGSIRDEWRKCRPRRLCKGVKGGARDFRYCLREQTFWFVRFDAGAKTEAQPGEKGFFP